MGVDRAAVVRKADEFVRQGKLDLAIAEYRALLDEQPSDMSAANTLGDLYARSGDAAKAIEQFTRLAESERTQGFTSKAIALYKKALKVDPGCEEALLQLADIAVRQELLADATLYWNRLVQRRRERNDAPGVARALIQLAGLPVAKADTKLAAARAAEPHVEAIETARLYAAAAEALSREGRDTDALDAWVEAGRRTDDTSLRQAAARACLARGSLDRAEPFLSVEVAGDEPALLWAVGERAAQAGDETVALHALGRYRTLVPDDAARASALLSLWEAATGPEQDAAPGEDSHQPVGEEVDLAALLADAPAEPPAPSSEPVSGDPETEAAVENADAVPLVEEVRVEEAIVDQPPVLGVMHDDALIELASSPAIDDVPVEVAAAAPLAERPPTVPRPDATESDDADREIDEAATIAQLQQAADTPTLQFQAAAQLGRWFLQKGQFDRGVEWLERACAVPAPVREHGLAARYDLADALERAGQRDRALDIWSDLEFDAGSYRDVADRLARLTRTLG
jgi:tetratricopeptide (TPR) repeat protein